MYFRSADSYALFKCLAGRMYYRKKPEEVLQFEIALSNWMNANSCTLQEGTLFYRAQIASETIDVQVDDISGGYKEPVPAPAGRMIPKPEFVKNNRVSPQGTVVLYLASDLDTAIKEARPSQLDLVTVAEFKVTRDLRIVAFDAEYRNLLFLQETSDASDDEVVINEINNAFSHFVHPADANTEYLPTQAIARLVVNQGFDGIGYRSSVGKGYNLALFDVHDAVALVARLYEVKEITYIYTESRHSRKYQKQR